MSAQVAPAATAGAFEAVTQAGAGGASGRCAESSTEVMLHLVAGAARPAVLTRFAPDSCIATTRVVIEALRYFGILARPWPVSLQLFNVKGWEFYQAHVPVREWPAEAWSIGMDGNIAGQVGHVVAVTCAQGARWRMIDASIDQAARPEKGLPPIPPQVGVIPAGWDLTRRDRGLLYQVGEVRLVYSPSGNQEFTRSRNWRRDQPDIRACVAETIRAVRDGHQEES